jgi:glycosyltransferase involved in cell wall biosynthesis
MPGPEPLRVGFVVKRYPRYSETFVVREILAHEEAGLPLEIFALRPPNDSHFQDLIARVRAPVHYLYLPSEGLVSEDLAAATLTVSYFWKALVEAAAVLPGIWAALAEGQSEEPRHVYQAVMLARAVKAGGINHLHAPFASHAASVARLASRFAGVPYSFTARAKDIFHQSVNHHDLRRKLADAAGVVTVSEYHLRYLHSTFGALATGVQRIYNGLDLAEFPYREPRERPPLVLAIGRLIEKKGFEDLIDACAILARRRILFRCRIIGAGPLREKLCERALRLDLADRVQLVGARPQRDVIEEIRGAAVLAAPCIVGKDGDRDGLPNVIQEALALGTPCVSTDVTGIPEVVRDGETGLQVPQRDAPALAAALARLLGDADLRVRLASRARRLIEAEFDIRRNTERRRAIFRSGARTGTNYVKEGA